MLVIRPALYLQATTAGCPWNLFSNIFSRSSTPTSNNIVNVQKNCKKYLFDDFKFKSNLKKKEHISHIHFPGGGGVQWAKFV